MAFPCAAWRLHKTGTPLYNVGVGLGVFPSMHIAAALISFSTSFLSIQSAVEAGRNTCHYKAAHALQQSEF